MKQRKVDFNLYVSPAAFTGGQQLTVTTLQLALSINATLSNVRWFDQVMSAPVWLNIWIQSDGIGSYRALDVYVNLNLLSAVTTVVSHDAASLTQRPFGLALWLLRHPVLQRRGTKSQTGCRLATKSDWTDAMQPRSSLTSGAWQRAPIGRRMWVESAIYSGPRDDMHATSGRADDRACKLLRQECKTVNRALCDHHQTPVSQCLRSSIDSLRMNWNEPGQLRRPVQPDTVQSHWTAGLRTSYTRWPVISVLLTTHLLYV